MSCERETVKDVSSTISNTSVSKSWVSTVGEISSLAERVVVITAPSMLVVGEVVQLHDTLNWFEELPLHGKGVVVITRARLLRQRVKGMGANLTLRDALAHSQNPVAVRLMEMVSNKKSSSIWL